jgi:hypothetical protein
MRTMSPPIGRRGGKLGASQHAVEGRASSDVHDTNGQRDLVVLEPARFAALRTTCSAGRARREPGTEVCRQTQRCDHFRGTNQFPVRRPAIWHLATVPSRP